MIFLIMGGCFAVVCEKEESHVEAKPQVEVEPERSQLPIEDIILPIGTERGKGWDQSIERLGIKRIKEMNAMLPKVAAFMLKAAQKQGKRLDLVGISDKSTKENAAFYGVCDDCTKYYISESDFTVMNGLKEK